MGANESAEIHVSFNHSDLLYYGGEQLAGTISFQNTHDKLTLDSIFLEFTGELGYTTRETRIRRDNNGHSSTEHYTEYHRQPFINTRIPVVLPQQGQREVTLYNGQYSWPFQFVLPQALPPTSMPITAAFPYVKYYARIVLDKPWYKPNARQIYALTIFPRVNISHMPHAQQPVPFSHINRKKLELQGFLVQAGVVPGQKLTVDVTLQNPKRNEIKRIEAVLLQHRQVGQTHQSETIFRMNLPGLYDFSGERFQSRFELHLPPANLSPTYAFNSLYGSRAILVSYNYELRLEVKARGLFTDFKVSVPVLVGTEPLSDQGPLVNNYSETLPASAPVYDYDEPPPAYESVVGTGKV